MGKTKSAGTVDTLFNKAFKSAFDPVYDVVLTELLETCGELVPGEEDKGAATEKQEAQTLLAAQADWLASQLTAPGAAETPATGAEIQALVWHLVREEFHAQLPVETKNRLSGDRRNEIDRHSYWSIWWRSAAAWYEGAKFLGVEFDEEALRDFTAWCREVPFLIGNSKFVITAKNPVEIHWRDGRLHNESGPAVRYADDWALYVIDGIAVDEQIVMHPETQTIEQIHKEDNADKRAIRINRFGWPRYLKETGAKEIDAGHNEVTNFEEALYEASDGSRRLVVVCPTGRMFSMGLPGSIRTCEEAQKWLADQRTDKPSSCLFRT